MKKEYGLKKETTKAVDEKSIITKENEYLTKEEKTLEEIKEESKNSKFSQILWWIFCMTLIILSYSLGMAKI